MNYSTIAAARYAIHQLTGINNAAVVEQVLAERHKRFVDDPRQSTYEDSPLPDTPEVRAVTDQVAAIMRGIDPRLEPAQQTILHSATYPSHIVLPIIPR